jgi:Glycosyl hydrolase family 79 C-terminal beta domain
MTDVGNQSMWQPIEVGGIDPWVRPVYYGHVVVDTLIGSANDTSIAEIDVTTQELQDYAGEASAYVIYRSNTIYATVLINMKEFNSTDTETSDTQLNFTVNIPPAYAGNNLTVLKLSAPGADSFKQVTWAGLDYQTDSGLPSVAATNDTTFVTVSAGGQFSVLVRDTQAVVVLFNSSAGVTLNTASAASSQGTSSSSENGNTTLLGTTNSTSGNSTDGSGGEGGSDSTKSAAFGRIMCNLPLMSVLCICTAMVLGANSFMFG